MHTKMLENEMADLAALVEAILARTREGKLGWEELSQTSFLTRVGEMMIIIDRPRSDQQPSMRITDDSGKLLQTIDAPIVSGALPVDLLFEVYDLARRQALKVDQRLSNLKRNLDRL